MCVSCPLSHYIRLFVCRHTIDFSRVHRALKIYSQINYLGISQEVQISNKVAKKREDFDDLQKIILVFSKILDEKLRQAKLPAKIA